jgi:hypothetical protein
MRRSWNKPKTAIIPRTCSNRRQCASAAADLRLSMRHHARLTVHTCAIFSTMALCIEQYIKIGLWNSPTRTMTPEQFIAKWQTADLKERAAAQPRFNDLCDPPNEQKPTDADAKGEWYCFEEARPDHRWRGLGAGARDLEGRKNFRSDGSVLRFRTRARSRIRGDVFFFSNYKYCIRRGFNLRSPIVPFHVQFAYADHQQRARSGYHQTDYCIVRTCHLFSDVIAEPGAGGSDPRGRGPEAAATRVSTRPESLAGR